MRDPNYIFFFYICSENGSDPCPGMCVAERVADYCEAILVSDELCKPGLRCCVTQDLYGDKKPNNLVVPNKNKGVNHTTHSHSTHTTSKPHILTTTPYTQPSKSVLKMRPCTGECVSGFFALFCEDVIKDADCPGDASCCVTNSPSEIPFTTTTPRVTTPPPLPRCPGFCIHHIMAAFCERPSVIIKETSSCKKGSMCCDNTRVPVTPKQKPRPAPTTTTAIPVTLKQDNRTDCPGSCIVSYLSFTCFRKFL